mgnify:CR=1 FL=1
MTALVEVAGLAKTFDVSAPWLNRVLERQPRRFVHAVDGVSFDIAENSTLVTQVDARDADLPADTAQAAAQDIRAMDELIDASLAVVREQSTGAPPVRLDLAALLQSLARPLQALTGGHRDAPRRQQTLRAALERSHALLDTDEHLSFRRPGVGTDVTQKLRKGKWSIQKQIDLHGLRSDEAREALGAFIREDNEVQADIEKVFVRFPRLKERRNQLAGTMSGGEQQMLAMGRALMAKPKVLLLDEPSMGLSPIMVDKIFEVVRDVSAQGVTIVLVEQNARMALRLAHSAYVLATGLVAKTGTGQELLDDPAVRQTYLGVEAHA